MRQLATIGTVACVGADHEVYGMTITAAKLISDIGTPVEVQRVLARIAMIERDTETLVKLAKLRDLSPEVDETLSGCDDLMVLVAWAERPGRTTE